jgi:hypothetical protein
MSKPSDNWQREFSLNDKLTEPEEPSRTSKLLDIFGFAYQLAGQVLIPNGLTPGQQERLEILLLDVLSDPERIPMTGLDEQRRVALLP